MSSKNKFINRVTLFIIIGWSLLIVFVGTIYLHQDYYYATSLAINEAKVSVKKDLAYRSWVASHGGVYVPITKNTPPNPYLAHIKNRDVTTNANQHLTLMNPAYTLSEMMKEYSKLYGVKAHITSLTLLNPKNRPDEWEKKTLEKIEKTRKPVLAKVEIGNEFYIRYMNPLVAKKSCLKCHAFQGYRIGDIRGGVSVFIPLKSYYATAFKHSLVDILTIVLIYFIGLISILYGKKFALKTLSEKIRGYEQHIYSLVNMIEKRDSYTAGHTKRVATYSILIAKEMGYGDKDIENLYRASMLHDIGKIAIPDSVLLKPGKLNALEYEIIKEHAQVGYELLKDVDIYKEIATIVRYHHERYDGSGYPFGLKGDGTLMLSQIMAVADAFNAMTTDRIYKTKKDINEALDELEDSKSKQFHPKIVDAAIKSLKNIKIDNTISQIPKTKMEKERFSYFFKDTITDAFNKDYLEFILLYNHTKAFDYNYICKFNLHNFTQYNRRKSWEDGDILLAKFAKKLDNLCSKCAIFRIHGDDFLIASQNKLDLNKDIEALETVLKDSGVILSFKCYDIKENRINSIKEIKNLEA
ncbi:MAG: DUF3365 domain-containing protein [Sulfurospirillum sp.]